MLYFEFIEYIMDVVSKIVCVVPFRLMDIKIAVDATVGVIQGPLNVREMQLGCYLPILSSQFFSKYKKGAIILIQELFEVLDSQEFWAQVRPVTNIQLVNGYNTLVNINLIKVSVYLVNSKISSSKNIDEYIRGFQMIDSKKKGKVPLKIEFLFSSFTIANKFFPRNLITIWVHKNSSLLESQSELQMHEYLFLSSNAYNRRVLMDTYLSRTDIQDNEKKDGLYKIREDSLISDPDERLDRILGAYYKNLLPSSQKQVEKVEKKSPKRKIDGIIQRTCSNKRFQPNPYKKALADKPLVRCASRFGNMRKLSITNIPQVNTRPTTAIKECNTLIDLSKVGSGSVLTLASSKDPYHTTTLRESIMSSYRLLPRKMSKITLNVIKSKLDGK